ncbi:MAG: hypothetical protein RIR16_409 [Actinomycetota bacterium]|jgi:NADPH-dependent 2,4-dienoyl-CoA reductase/sulfur reductase-like enzyme/rhodanese-related sulfurtransferase
MRVIIIGGVAAGMSAAARLRRLDETAEIVVYEMGEHVSYANCGLPYFVSDVISNRASLLLQTPESLWTRFRIQVKTGTMVTSIDREAKTVKVLNFATGEELQDSYDKLVISTGARPRKPQIPGVERAMVLRNVTDADQVKAAVQKNLGQKVVILGGGFVGIELAENLARLDVDTTLVQRADTVLAQFDSEMIEPFQAELVKHGVKLELNAEALEITADSVVLQDGKTLQADLVVAAAGVTPDNSLAREAGLKIGESGGLVVDGQQRTSDQNIYAAGDAVEKLGLLTSGPMLIPLANLANRHGRLIADAIVGREVNAHQAIGTVIIGAFGFAAAITGLSEKLARRAGIDYRVLHVHPNNHAGYYPGATRVSIKVLFDPNTGKILGGQANGADGVDKRIDVIATAIHGGLTVQDLMDLELAYAPQFGSAKDAINIAGYVGDNLVTGTTESLQWFELESAIASGAQLIDVRSDAEHGAGSIPGAINLSVDQLREKLDQIQQDNVVVHCQVGQRGHVAAQILKAHGKTRVRNLDGGYITWRAAKDALQRSGR